MQLVSRCLAFPCKRGSQRAVVPWPFVVPWTSGACGRLPRRYLCTILTCVHLRAYVHLCRHHRHAELPSLVSHTHVAHSFPSAFPRAHLSSLGLFVTWRLSVNNIAPSSVFALHRCTLFCVCIVIIAPASVSTLHRLLCLSAPCGLSRSLPRYASRANVPGLYVDSSWYGDSGQRFFGSL